MNLRQAARLLGGDVVNGQILAPGPGHSHADRSLAVRPSPSARDGFVVHSHAGDDWRECATYVRQRLGIDDCRRGTAGRYDNPRLSPSPRLIEADNRNGDRAREIFAESIEPRGTLAEEYLARERGLSGVLDDRLALTLRYHRRCPFGAERAPALIAAVRCAWAVMAQCAMLGELEEVERAILSKPELIVAVQRIRLTPDGRKVRCQSLGQMGDGVAFIGSVWELFYGAQATIAEGVETALAMQIFGHGGVVALGGAGRFRSFEPPYHWADITIAGENDGGASEAGWRAAGNRWAAGGRTVKIWLPPEGCKDANDVLIEGLK
jgi:putative DNA primase/helicase